MDPYLSCRLRDESHPRYRQCKQCPRRDYCDVRADYLQDNRFAICLLNDTEHPLYKKCWNCPHKNFCDLTAPQTFSPLIEMPRRCFRPADYVLELFLIEAKVLPDDYYYYDRRDQRWMIKIFSWEDWFWRFIDWWL